MILAYVELVVEYLITPDWILASDTVSYVHTWEFYRQWSLEGFRTPVYPLFYGLFNWCGHTPVGEFLMLLTQKTVHIIACYYLFRLMSLLGFSGKICFWVMSIWLLIPGVFLTDWDSMMLTESLTCSMFVFFLWSTVSFKLNPGFHSAVAITIWLLLLVFIRPANIFLLPLTGLFFIACLSGHLASGRCWSVFGLSLVVLCGGSVWAFGRYTDEKTGNGPMTYVSTVNNVWFIMEAGINNPKYIDDPERREAYAEFIKNCPDADGWAHCSALGYKDPKLAETRKFIRKAIISEPEKAIEYLGRRAGPFLSDYVVSVFWPPQLRPVRPYIIPRIWIALVLVLLTGIFAMVGLRRRDNQETEGIGRICQYRWIYLWICVLTLSLYLVIYLGAMSDWGRLSSPVMSFVMICACQVGRIARFFVNRRNFVERKWLL